MCSVNFFYPGRRLLLPTLHFNLGYYILQALPFKELWFSIFARYPCAMHTRHTQHGALSLLACSLHQLTQTAELQRMRCKHTTLFTTWQQPLAKQRRQTAGESHNFGYFTTTLIRVHLSETGEHTPRQYTTVHPHCSSSSSWSDALVHRLTKHFLIPFIP